MFKAIKNVKRMKQIATIMGRHGLADLLDRYGFSRFLSFKKSRPKQSAKKMTRAERFCKVLYDLGPTFIKLGQVLATRVDLLDDEWIAALSTLQDQVDPLPYSVMKKQLTKGLKQKPDEVFKFFNNKPLAAGSIAQVYQAELHSGQEVVVKVLKPGIEKTIAADISLLMFIAETAEKYMRDDNYFSPVEVVQSFAQSITAELDLLNEINNLQRVKENFKESKFVVIPKAYPELSSRTINVQELVQGIPGRDVDAAVKAGMNLKLLCQHGSEAALQMIFTDGFFHADPHPGNVFYLKPNKVAFIDFGMTGYISEKLRQQLVLLMYSIVKKNTRGVIRVLETWNDFRAVNDVKLEVDIDLFLDRYHGLSLKELNLSQMLTDITEILRQHRMSLPSSLALLIKVFLTLEGFARNLDDEYNLVVSAEPFLKKAFLSKYDTSNIKQQLQESLFDSLDVIETLPIDVKRVLRIAQRGQFGVEFNPQQQDNLLKTIIKSGKLVATAIISGALFLTGVLFLSVSATQLPLYAIIIACAAFGLAGLGVLMLLIQFMLNR